MQSVCCIVELEGFLVPRKTSSGAYDDLFLIRELAYVRVSPGDERFVPKSRHFDLTKFQSLLLDPVASRAVELQEQNCICGLPFCPTPGEDALHYDECNRLLESIYGRCRTERNNAVAYAGGYYEMRLLTNAQLIGLDIHSHGCPDFESLNKDDSYSGINCGQHTQGALCPLSRVAAYRDWLYGKRQSHNYKY